MKCIYDGKAATAFDLCHGRSAVCDTHHDVGHQYEPIVESEPKAAEPKPVKATKR